MKNFLPDTFNYLRPIKMEVMRIGKDKDGGYIFPKNEFKNIDLIISLGMGSESENWSFEQEYLKKNKNTNVIFYDHTVSIKNYMISIFRIFRRLIKMRYRFKDLINILRHFFYYLILMCNSKIFHIKKKICKQPNHINEINIEEIFNKTLSNKVLLKVDIEGSEYEIIDQIINFSDKIVSLIIEFHHIDKFESSFQEKIMKLKTKFEIIHIHGNNNTGILDSNIPKTLELTFVNKANYKGNKNDFIYDFPIEGIDFPNNPNFKDIYFSFRRAD
jgi:hypothetical protein|tara:strand:- start:259 stop:1077 length:819 start_codon:yes stop_codon:yes gene_type:complete